MISGKKEMGNTIDTEILLALYRKIRTIRRFGETGMKMYNEGHIYGYYHSYIGEEAVAAGTCLALRNDDYIVSNHRGHGHYIAKGGDLKRIMAELYGRIDGYAYGRSGSMHISNHSSGNIGGNGIVGAGIPIAAGVAMGIKLEKSDRVVVCFLGDGATNNGVFAESLNLAAIYRLPVLYIIENNCYAATTHVRSTAVCENLSMRAQGYGIEGSTINGNDPVEVYEHVSRAVSQARNGEGPSLIEAKTYRHFGHHIGDSGAYMPKEEMEKWKANDPFDIILKYLKNASVEKTLVESINAEIEHEIEEALKFAEQSPEPDTNQFLNSIELYDE